MKLNLRAIDLNLLTLFDALMTEGKLSQAAEKLSMTQPAASNALQRLRLTVNDELFIRTRNGMIPTTRAKELHPPIQQALRLIQFGLSPQEKFDAQRSTQVFAIAATDYGETVLLSRLISETKNNRNISFILSRNPEENQQLLLAQGALDLIIDYQIDDHNNIQHELLTYEEVVIIVDKNHPRIQKSCSKEQYFNEHHIVLPPRNQDSRPLEALIDRTLKTRKIAVQVTQFSAMPPLIRDSDLIAAMPKRQADSFKDAFNLTLLPLPFDLPPIPLFQSWHNSRETDSSLIWLRKSLIESLKT